MKTRKIINELSKELGKEVNLLILNERKLKQLKEKDYEFYLRLKLRSVTFNGEVFD